nr:MAG TPA: hypothetical protein [Caudoviricetes sp.]
MGKKLEEDGGSCFKLTKTDLIFIKQALIYTYFGLKEELRNEDITEESATIIKASIDHYMKIKMKLEGKEDE